MEILTYGNGERLLACSSAVAAGCPGDCRIIILPIPTTRDGKTVAGTDVSLSEVCSRVERGMLVAGYSIPEEMAAEIVSRGGNIYDGSLDEELILANARLTAYGTLGWLLTNGSLAPEELAVGLVGYGRIGKELLRLLLFLGYKVRVYSSCADTRTTLSEHGIEVRDSRCGIDFSGLDILINTAPAPLISRKARRGNSELLILDLASGKYLEGIEGVVKLPSVPEKYFARGAGRLYAERILKRLGSGSPEEV